jgi:hypothetical protein
VETADGASSAEQAAVPQAQSLVERAKQVVETQFVDEAFTVSACHLFGVATLPWWRRTRRVVGRMTAPGWPAVSMSFPAVTLSRRTLFQNWRPRWGRCALGRNKRRQRLPNLRRLWRWAAARLRACEPVGQLMPLFCHDEHALSVVTV